MPAAGTGVTPRPHQRDALAAVLTVFRSGAARAQVRMACGTGKTFLGAWLAEDLAARTVVVFEPSIALVGQTVERWRSTGLAVRTLAVCSDPTTVAGRDEIGVDGVDPYQDGHDRDGVTTDSAVLAGFLDRAAGFAGVTVVVCTYHSASVVADALTMTDRARRVDLLIGDEAHHLAGRTDARFLPVLYETRIPASHRLFQTATPIVMGNLAALDPLDEVSGAASRIRSMDNEALFGTVAYSLLAGDAIERGLLSDYQVVVASAPGRDARSGASERATLASLTDAVTRYGVRRILTFHNRVAAARAFAARVDALGEVGGLPVRAWAVDGSMREHQRHRILGELADSDDGRRVTVVSSAQCLREGIDVPAVDAVVFADPRSSATGIIQAVGRALRPHPGKTLGTIVVPLVTGGDSDVEQHLDDSSFQHVWRVLRGLRAHDARIAADLDRARRSRRSRAGGDPSLLPWLRVHGDDPGAVITRLLERTSALWEQYFGLLTAQVRQDGSAAAISTTAVVDGLPLGTWITTQRIDFADGRLDTERARRLEAVPGWQWNASRAADERTVQQLDSVVAEHGSLTDNPVGTSIYAGRTCALGRPLSRWVATQIFRYHDRGLESWLGTEVEKRPGWSWAPLDPGDTAVFEAYRQFVAWEKHADVPTDHVEDGQAVGEWLWQVRRRKLIGTLAPALEAMLLAAIPTSGNGERRFLWRKSETQWRLALDAAHGYIARGGRIDTMPVDHTETVDGHPVNLYRWATRVRRTYNTRRTLTADQVADVEALPGWQWSKSTAGHRSIQIGDPIDIGDRPHGWRGYDAGCSCAVCVGGKRAYHRAHEAARIQRYRKDWVDARDVTVHLTDLIDAEDRTRSGRAERSITPGAIAAAAGVQRGVVSGLLSGKETSCHPLHRLALLAVSAEEVRAARSAQGSRGRRSIANRNKLVDPAPTWALIDELTEHGWQFTEIVAGLGYRTTSLPFTRDRVSATHAKLVRLLHDSLAGDLTPPDADHRPPQSGIEVPVHRHDSDAERWARSMLDEGYQVEHAARMAGLPPALAAALVPDLEQEAA